MAFFNPANVATLLRLLLAPWVAWLILDRRPLAALILFFAAGLTDVIDGALARRFQLASTTGAYLDPIADKVLLSTVCICLALRSDLPWWFVAVIFGRDVLILTASALALAVTGVRKFPPSVWGKLSTLLQIIATIAWMVRDLDPASTLDSVARALIWPALAATIWSGLHYAWRGARILRAH